MRIASRVSDVTDSDDGARRKCLCPGQPHRQEAQEPHGKQGPQGNHTPKGPTAFCVDLQQLQLKHQHGTRRNGPSASITVCQVARQNNLPLLARSHQLQSF